MSGVVAELAELALVNLVDQVDDVTTDQLRTTPYKGYAVQVQSSALLCTLVIVVDLKRRRPCHKEDNPRLCSWRIVVFETG